MKTLKFRSDFETADMVIRLEVAHSKFTVVGRTEIMVEDNEPVLVLPPTFISLLRERLSEKGASLIGVVKNDGAISLILDKKTLIMKGRFSINDVMAKL